MTEGSGNFSVGERVLVPHTDKFYEAKVLRAEQRPREDGTMEWHYFLHYIGWNKNWDEWVEEAGMQKCPQTSIKKPSLKERSLKKRKVEECNGESTHVQVDVEIPALLKKQLVEDYEAINEEKKLLPLPRHPCVWEICSAYINQVASERTQSKEEEEIAHGLRVYFDKALSQCLLYSAEKDQADTVLRGHQVTASSVYGAEHFLRLFVKLPELLPQTGVSEEAAQELTRQINDFLRFLHINKDKYFLTKEEYANAQHTAPSRAKNN